MHHLIYEHPQCHPSSAARLSRDLGLDPRTFQMLGHQHLDGVTSDTSILEVVRPSQALALKTSRPFSASSKMHYVCPMTIPLYDARHRITDLTGKTRSFLLP